MRTTITIDDELLQTAREFTGIHETPILVRLALQEMVQREAARRLSRLGGSQPDFKAAPRHRPDDQ
ncbi:antitoxin VapB [Pseudorhizobium endolithicum]|uniref:Antitoxin VapB n=1 Tax=Pseudorhizobium endolithicum TaxID=1191678 RepID=A0ABN7JIJ7_9HYPH|nr:type II toxin-antitoxin system VapB family antitoxin [Pseudorhizobium endolithicum]CAD6420724.1 antitoxin VapB [Rhizobium sp. Q54]CAD7026942.1 antitoxin VapB [Pseudorhizobium endolithicum]